MQKIYFDLDDIEHIINTTKNKDVKKFYKKLLKTIMSKGVN